MKNVLLISMVVCLVFLIGCASVGTKKPDWINKGAGAFANDKKSLYGVGVAEAIKSESLRRLTADNRAMAEISKQIQAISTSLMRDYMASTSALEDEKTGGEQYVENCVKTFTSSTLSGVKIIDRWDNGKVLYSLAVLNIEDLRGTIDQAKTLNYQMKEYIKVNAEKAFDKLEVEQTKRGN
jgi:hypothetical protein